MIELTISDFPHSPPDGYTYEFKQFNTCTIAIWLCCNRKFDYNLGKSTKTIWGFYNPKKREYYAPVNSSKQGEKVRIELTTNYTAMQIKLNQLEKFFV
jgi:hypothetical protein